MRLSARCHRCYMDLCPLPPPVQEGHLNIVTHHWGSLALPAHQSRQELGLPIPASSGSWPCVRCAWRIPILTPRLLLYNSSDINISSATSSFSDIFVPDFYVKVIQKKYMISFHCTHFCRTKGKDTYFVAWGRTTNTPYPASPIVRLDYTKSQPSYLGTWNSKLHKDTSLFLTVKIQ